jgi:hypothetical protein
MIEKHSPPAQEQRQGPMSDNMFSNLQSASVNLSKKYSSRLMQLFQDQPHLVPARESNNAVPLATRTLRDDLRHVKAAHME